MKKLFKALGLFCFSFLLGYAMLIHTSEWAPSGRDPAAVRQVYDFSNLNGSDLTDAIKQRLLKGALVVREHESLGIQLGHFALARATGEKTMACQEYKSVTLRFEADGVAVNGDRPVMEVEGPCEFSADINSINPLMIPIDKVLAEKPVDGEIQYREGQDLTLRFRSMPDAWPKRWLLTGVRLSSITDQKQIQIDAEELSQILGRPLMLNFSKPE